MEGSFEELRRRCREGVEQLRDPSWAASLPCEASRIRTRGELRAWRQRLEETAKGIEFCGGYLFVQGGEGPRYDVRLNRLIEHAGRIALLAQQLPITVGRQYASAVREAAATTLIALARLPDLYASMRRTHQPPAPFLWNQTLRLRDMPEDAHAHLLIKWERWLIHLRELSDELRAFRHPPSNCPSHHLIPSDSLPGLKEPWSESEKICLSAGERNVARECEAIVKLVRSLFRRIRMRCLSVEDLPPILIDEIYAHGEHLVLLIDELATMLSPPFDLFILVATTSRISTIASLLATLAAENCPIHYRKWFELCLDRIDLLLFPLLERTPLR